MTWVVFKDDSEPCYDSRDLAIKAAERDARAEVTGFQAPERSTYWVAKIVAKADATRNIIQSEVVEL